MVEACLRKRVHYLDITGEIEVFEACAARDAEARAAGVMLLPGTGFDVVPSDCLAAHLKSRLPTATHLALGFQVAARGLARHGHDDGGEHPSRRRRAHGRRAHARAARRTRPASSTSAAARVRR